MLKIYNMGNSSSSSTVNQKYNTTLVNQSDINLLNETVNDFIADTIVTQAAKCTSDLQQTQKVDLRNMMIGGNLDIGTIDQNQASAVTLDCVQVSAFQNDIANGILTKYTEAMKNSFDTTALDKLDAAASSNSQNSFATTGASNSDSSVNVDYKFSNTNIVSQNLQNVVKNSIKNNLSLNDISDCIGSIKSTQIVDLNGTRVAGNTKIGIIRQDQAAQLLTKCLQEKNNSNKITNSVATAIELKIDNTSKVKKQTEISSGTTATSTNSGLFQSIGEGLKSMFEGLGAMFGSMYIGPILSVICCVCIIVIILVLIFSGGKSSSNPNSTSYESISSGDVGDVDDVGDDAGDAGDEKMAGGFNQKLLLDIVNGLSRK